MRCVKTLLPPVWGQLLGTRHADVAYATAIDADEMVVMSTVRREIPGSCASAVAKRISADGWAVFPLSRQKLSWRCGVTFRPQPRGHSKFGRRPHAGKARESIAICNYCRLAIGEELQAMMFLPGLEPQRSARDAGDGYEHLRTL